MYYTDYVGCLLVVNFDQKKYGIAITLHAKSIQLKHLLPLKSPEGKYALMVVIYVYLVLITGIFLIVIYVYHVSYSQCHTHDHAQGENRICYTCIIISLIANNVLWCNQSVPTTDGTFSAIAPWKIGHCPLYFEFVNQSSTLSF